MFIPVIRCEEEDLYFIVVECIQAASARLFRKHLPPPEARCNPSSHRGEADAFSQLLISLIKVPVLPAIPPEATFLQSFLGLAGWRAACVWAGGAACWTVPDRFVSLRAILLDPNRL